MFRTAILILSGNATASLLLLVRNLLVARLIPVEDYGVATTFAVVMAIVEMASAFGLQQQIVQSKDGDDPRFQAVLQGFQMLRGVIAGILLFLISGPIARFLGIPEVIWAYQLLALVPVVRAFEHFDIHRLNREMRFWPLILTGGVPALLSLLMIWPLAAWLGDWRVMLYAILAQIGLTTLTSHLVAERYYRLAFDRAIMERSLRFGGPILVNAILLFFIFQGDKLIIGRVLGMEALAIFAMGMTLALAPTLVMAKSTQNIFLARLSKANRKTREGEARFQHLAIVAIEVHMLISAGFICFITIFDQLIINILLGEKYSKLVDILVMISVIQCVRLLKSGPSVVAFSSGQTEIPMISNFPRIFLLPFVYWVAIRTENLDFILLIALAGELIGLFIAFALLCRRSGILLKAATWPLMIVLIIFILAIFETNAYLPNTAIGAILGLFIVSFLTMQKLRSYLSRLFRSSF